MQKDYLWLNAENYAMNQLLELITTNASARNPQMSINKMTFWLISHRVGIGRSSIENDIEFEVARYLMDVRTDNIILNEYPNVREVYFKFNTTLSSSAPVEGVFSQSMMIFTPRRNRLSVSNFEIALMYKHNWKIIF